MVVIIEERRRHLAAKFHPELVDEADLLSHKTDH